MAGYDLSSYPALRTGYLSGAIGLTLLDTHFRSLIHDGALAQLESASMGIKKSAFESASSTTLTPLLTISSINVSHPSRRACILNRRVREAFTMCMRITLSAVRYA